MRNFIIIASVFLFLQSCITEKKRQKICNTCAVKDSISYKEIIKLKDTIIYRDIAGPVQYLENPCKLLCDSLGKLKPFEIKTKKNGLISTIKSVGNSIAVDCSADSLKLVISGLKETVRDYSSRKSVIRYVECTKKHRSDFDGLCRWFFYIFAPGIALYIFLRLKKIIP